MLVVYIPGVWDLIHVGHVTVLQRAAALGDKLIVGVASDAAVYEDKKHSSVIREQDRATMVGSLSCVDFSVVYLHLEFLTHLEMFKPDVLAVGSTWGKDDRHKRAEQWVICHRKRLVILPYTPGVSSSKIRKEVLRK